MWATEDPSKMLRPPSFVGQNLDIVINTIKTLILSNRGNKTKNVNKDDFVTLFVTLL